LPNQVQSGNNAIMKTLFSAIKKELAAIEVSERKIREFAYVVGGVLIALALFATYRGHVSLSAWVGGGGVILVVTGILHPMILLPLYRIWMGLAVVLGVVVGNVVLTLFYFLAVTPIGLLRRLFRNTALDKGKSYWIPLTTAFKKESLEQPF
jgi:hypothetical protein